MRYHCPFRSSLRTPCDLPGFCTQQMVGARPQPSSPQSRTSVLVSTLGWPLPTRWGLRLLCPYTPPHSVGFPAVLFVGELWMKLPCNWSPLVYLLASEGLPQHPQRNPQTRRAAAIPPPFTRFWHSSPSLCSEFPFPECCLQGYP